MQTELDATAVDSLLGTRTSYSKFNLIHGMKRDTKEIQSFENVPNDIA